MEIHDKNDISFAKNKFFTYSASGALFKRWNIVFMFLVLYQYIFCLPFWERRHIFGLKNLYSINQWTVWKGAFIQLQKVVKFENWRFCNFRDLRHTWALFERICWYPKEILMLPTDTNLVKTWMNLHQNTEPLVVQSESSDGLIDGAIWWFDKLVWVGMCPVTSVANLFFGYTAWVYILLRIKVW